MSGKTQGLDLYPGLDAPGYTLFPLQSLVGQLSCNSIPVRVFKGVTRCYIQPGRGHEDGHMAPSLSFLMGLCASSQQIAHLPILCDLTTECSRAEDHMVEGMTPQFLFPKTFLRLSFLVGYHTHNQIQWRNWKVNVTHRSFSSQGVTYVLPKD